MEVVVFADVVVVVVVVVIPDGDDVVVVVGFVRAMPKQENHAASVPFSVFFTSTFTLLDSKLFIPFRHIFFNCTLHGFILIPLYFLPSPHLTICPYSFPVSLPLLFVSS